jgi:hypothetical protein
LGLLTFVNPPSARYTMNMETMLSKYLPAALLAICLQGQASAQGSALQELFGAARGGGSIGSVPAPEVSMPEDVNRNDEFVYVDRGNAVPQAALQAALTFYKANRYFLGNHTYLSVIDYTRHASEKRFHVINMRTGEVESFLVAHGQGSDPSHSGFASRFSNENNTHATSLGFFKTGETYEGGHGYSLRLNGLSSTNSNALDRAIVIHGADYVASLGRSWGCPAVEMSVRTALIDKLKGGSIIYAYHEGFSRE